MYLTLIFSSMDSRNQPHSSAFYSADPYSYREPIGSGFAQSFTPKPTSRFDAPPTLSKTPIFATSTNSIPISKSKIPLSSLGNTVQFGQMQGNAQPSDREDDWSSKLEVENARLKTQLIETTNERNTLERVSLF